MLMFMLSSSAAFAMKTADGAPVPTQTPSVKTPVKTPLGPQPAKPSAVTVGAFAAQMQKKFALPQPAVPVKYADLKPGDANYAAAQAIAPYLNRQILCPGCVLSANFGANQPLPRSAAAVFLVSVLVARNQIQLASTAETESVLAKVPDGKALPPVQQRYIATAIKNGLLPLHAGNAVHSNVPLTPVEMNQGLEKIQLQFKLTPAKPQPANEVKKPQ
jgi:hypothetical protein